MEKSTSPLSWRRFFSAAYVVSDDVSQLSKWIETVVIPLIAIGIAWLSNPADPLLRGALFPWLWLAPALVALRYGVLPGLVAGTLILVDWFAADAIGMFADFPREYFFGGGLLTLLCGEFSDVWRDRMMRIDETNLYLIERLSGLTKRHLLLNLSHDRLEQEMLARPGSLRDALVRLRAAVVEATDTRAGDLPGTANLLQLLAQYVNIEAAVLYKVADGGTEDGVALGAMIGKLGEPLLLESGDELLKLAFETRNLAHIAESELSMARNSNQLVVAPLVASDNTLIGILAVTRLPFFSLNVENLQMMSVILAYYADNVHVAPLINETSRQLPSIPQMYAEELGRLVRMQKSFSIVSHIVVMSFRGQRRVEIPTELLGIKRGLDLFWETSVDGHPAIIVLMPFATTSAKDGFLKRIDGWLKMRFGGSFESLQIEIRAINFASEDPLEALARIVQK